MRYFLDHDRDRPEWVIYEAAEPGNGTVALVLPGALPRADAEKARLALARARAQGRREVADEITHLAQALRAREPS